MGKEILRLTKELGVMAYTSNVNSSGSKIRRIASLRKPGLHSEIEASLANLV